MQTTHASVLVLACLLAAGRAACAAELEPPASTVAPPHSEAAEPALARVSADATAPLRWSASGAVEEGGYRLSLSRGSFDVGLRFESRLAATRQLDARVDSAAPAGATLPALSFGLHSIGSAPAPASTLAERALGSATTVPAVSKVGIEWKPAQSRVFFHQGLGFRLDGDDRLIMRLRKGSLGLYMHRTF